MAIPSGLSSQWGLKMETTYGTYVAPDRFYPLVNETVKNNITMLDSNAIISGANLLRSQQWAQGTSSISGDVNLELYNLGLGLLLRAMTGAIATAGSGPYTHTATIGDLSDDFFTMQVGRTDIGGTTRAFSYLGCLVNTWTIACNAGEIATLSLNVIGRQETTAQALASVSYASGVRPMTFLGGALTIGGSAGLAHSVTLTGDNKIAQRFFFADQYSQKPLPVDLKDVSGSFAVEFEDLTAYNRYVNGTETAVVLTFAAGAQTLVITMNVRFEGETPVVPGKGTLTLTMPFKCIGTTTDASAFSAVFTTTESTP